ncbi:uncharacterized protein RCO7_14500 [Rhynchosporium graminicola]|uniref:Uncharacterized protein n=1 Tax=Rhynchosporium graminicola TaxID=2792576 RepID=A0A1E1KKM7_9HELO|nr:uncharacterized protein RCO7_14500 [Rhynchosporium commune]
MSENGYSQSTAGAATSNSALVPDFSFPSWVFNRGGFEAPQGFANHAYRYHQQGMELQGTSYFGIDTESDYLHPLTTLTSLHDFELTSPGSELARNHTVHSWPLSATPSLMDLDTGSVPVQFSAASLPSSSHVINLPFQKVSGSSNTGVRSNIRSLFRPKSDTSFRGRKRYAISKLTDSTADSGYAGCHTSTLSLKVDDQNQVQSSRGLNGLYRVKCHVLHEPHSKAQHKDIPTCTACHYGGIHNLSWSARHLKLEIFLGELRPDDVYDSGARDAVGNTALHELFPCPFFQSFYF